MRCPFCHHPDTRVVDSRPTEDGSVIRRRRECLPCSRRFTTYEKVEEVPLLVVKKDGRRERFEPRKLLEGLLKACEKRPVPVQTLERTVREIEAELRNAGDLEVSSQVIGEMVMERLRRLDDIAYVRFASVYRQFKDINRFREELEKLLGEGLERT